MHIDPARALNQGCYCVSLDEDALRDAVERELGDPALHALLLERCPHVFATSPVFISAEQAARMRAVVAAIDAIAGSQAWRDRVLADAGGSARIDPRGARGVLFGYDFHVEGDRIGLIEINTNAGGAMLNAVLGRAQRACCAEVEQMVPVRARIDAFETRIIAMFQEEWARAGRTTPLARIAIVDEAPEQQYLYPEFLLFQRLFRRHGIDAVIADPSMLQLRDNRLVAGDAPIDLVYNRLTDFSLDHPGNAVLREAYATGSVLVTPHPQAHALLADKRNLVLLGDDAALHSLGVDAATRRLLLEHVPRTERVGATNAEALWQQRRQWFFKPVAGYGSRAAYRGDKLTRRVWQEIVAGDYVAQALVQPGQRAVAERESTPLKFDLRLYAYAGRVLWIAARLYQGQTTNFRTPGGGFAPVYELPAVDVAGGRQPPEAGIVQDEVRQHLSSCRSPI
jgi:hypothetical protein